MTVKATGIITIETYTDYDDLELKVLSWCAENDQTLINGAKIYTGSITADQIAAGGISIKPTQSLIEYLFATEAEVDSEGNLISDIGIFNKIDEDIDALTNEVNGGIIYDESGNPVYELDENGKKIPELDEDGNELKDEDGNVIYKYKIDSSLRAEINSVHADLGEQGSEITGIKNDMTTLSTKSDVAGALNSLLGQNDNIRSDYKSFFKFVDIDPLKGIIIRGADITTDENDNAIYATKPKQEYVYDEASKSYVLQTILDESGNPVLIPDYSQIQYKESPFSVGIDNQSFSIYYKPDDASNEIAVVVLDDSSYTINSNTGKEVVKISSDNEDGTMKASNVTVKKTLRIGDYSYEEMTASNGVKTLNLFYKPETN